MHYYQFNIGDYKSHTEHLSDTEDLAYRRMLDLYYLHEKPLPPEVEQIARLIRMRTHCECIANVLREFFTQTENGWENTRANSEISCMDAKSRKASDSAKARWSSKNSSQALQNNANAMRTHTERNAKAMLGECEGNATHNTRHITQDTEHKKDTATRKSATPSKPEGVDEQVWADWQALRKQKRASVTETVMRGAEAEALKAGMTLNDFLAVWCQRGSQGLEAGWLKPHERGKFEQKSFAERSADHAAAEVAKWAPSIAAKREIFTIEEGASNAFRISGG